MRDLKADASRSLVQGFIRLYPEEAARFVGEMAPKRVVELLKEEPMDVATKLFVRINPEAAVEAIGAMDDSLFRFIFTAIDPAKGASLLARLDKPLSGRLLEALPEPLAKEYRELMAYPPDSAGAIMDPRVATFRADEHVAKVLKKIRSIRDRRIIDVCIVDGEGMLEAIVPLQEVAVAQPSQKIGELAGAQPASIHSMSPREDVVKLIEELKLASLPVVDLDGRLLGIIRYDAIVRAARAEVSEDVMTMFGAGRDERALSRVSFAVKKRLPWLHINLGTAFLAALVVGIFEDTIAKITILAVFLPVVAGQSGNTGSQALAVTMRGLVLREIRPRNWPTVARKELLVGLTNGVAIAFVTAVAVYLWASSAGLSLVIGVAMVLSMVVAGVSGVFIPVTLKKLGFDPAQSSSIILTTVTDVVGFMSFLGLGTLLSGMIGAV